MSDPAPAISILIHNRNRADVLDRCLESVSQQTARPLEVVVLDAESTDDSPNVVAKHAKQLAAKGIRVVSETCPPTGVPESRNRAASLATGDLLFFIDNDATLDSPGATAWLQHFFHHHDEVGLAGCQILAGDREEEDPFCWVYRRDVSRWRKVPFDTFTFAGAGFCARKQAYEACGGFWEVIDYSREEEALALRMLDQHWKVQYRPEVVVRHYPDSRGRRALIDRRAVELKNGVLIYWHAYPAGLGLLFSLLRVCSMACRTLIRREGSLRTLLAGWPAAQACWRDRDLKRQPVAWGTMIRLVRLHFSRGLPRESDS